MERIKKLSEVPFNVLQAVAPKPVSAQLNWPQSLQQVPACLRDVDAASVLMIFYSTFVHRLHELLDVYD